MPRSSKKIAAARQLFEAEARPHLDALYAMALRLTRSPVDAEDLTQDTLVRAYRFYDRFEAGTNFKAWLLRIQMNTFVNRYRRAPNANARSSTALWQRRSAKA
jgi:RNA polymerase sigma-70 factor (ECF subfamily)